MFPGPRRWSMACARVPERRKKVPPLLAVR
jgi:hypothetical protein